MKPSQVLFLLAILVAPPAAFCKGKGRLYNLKTGEVLVVQFTRALFTGHGKIWVTLANGKQLKGEYSVVRDGATAWGSVYSTVSGYGGSAYGSGTAMSSVSSDVARGAGIIAGEGKVLDCEFVTGGIHGSGGCRDNTNGDLYRLIF